MQTEQLSIQDLTQKFQQLESSDTSIEKMDSILMGIYIGRMNKNVQNHQKELDDFLNTIIILNKCQQSIPSRFKEDIYNNYINDPTINVIINQQYKFQEFVHQKLQYFEQNKDGQVPLSDVSNPKEDTNECQICLDSLEIQNMWPLTNCSHIFHRQCLNQSFKAKIEEKAFPLKCPNQDCLVSVNDIDVQETLDEEMTEKYNQFMIQEFIDNHVQDMSWCPSPNCPYAFFFQQADTYFLCPHCNKEYCMKCRVEYHIDLSCQEYKISNTFDGNDQNFIDFVQGHKFKQCPQCRFWVEKSAGCDHMTCRCRYEFCYICGGKYRSCSCQQVEQEQNTLVAGFPRIQIIQPTFNQNSPRIQIIQPQNIVVNEEEDQGNQVADYFRNFDMRQNLILNKQQQLKFNSNYITAQQQNICVSPKMKKRQQQQIKQKDNNDQEILHEDFQDNLREMKQFTNYPNTRSFKQQQQQKLLESQQSPQLQQQKKSNKLEKLDRQIKFLQNYNLEYPNKQQRQIKQIQGSSEQQFSNIDINKINVIKDFYLKKQKEKAFISNYMDIKKKNKKSIDAQSPLFVQGLFDQDMEKK